MKEIWKYAVGYEGKVMVSSFGRIKRMPYEYFNKGVKKMRTELIRKPSLSQRYYTIRLFDKTVLVHRVVAEAFIPNPEKKLFVNHIDGNKTNNSVNNLEWCTSSENSLHAYKAGMRKAHTKRGKESHFARLNEKDVLAIREKYEKGGFTQRQVAKEYSVTQSTIYQIINKISWNHI
jgi:hypothetical protein